MKYFPFAALLGAAIAGCAAPPPPLAVDGPSAVDRELLRATQRVQDSISRLAISQERAAQTLHPSAPRTSVDMNFVGTLDAALQALAATVGYEFASIGKPTQPVIVSAIGRTRPWIELVQSLSLQLGVRGEIVVDVANKRVEVRYGA